MSPFKRMSYDTCWQYMNCPQEMRKECVVYKTDMKEPCWVSNSKKRYDILGTCTTCPWFLKSNPSLEHSTF